MSAADETIEVCAIPGCDLGEDLRLYFFPDEGPAPVCASCAAGLDQFLAAVRDFSEREDKARRAM